VSGFLSYTYPLSKILSIYYDILMESQQIPAIINPNAANPTISKIRIATI
jgi:hypothetical protein